MTDSLVSQDPNGPGPSDSSKHSGRPDHAAKLGSWADLLGPQHLAAALVLAGGVALYAMNVYLTAALMPSAITEIGGQEYYAWVVTSFLTASVIASMLVNRVLGAAGPARAYVLAFLIFGIGSLVNLLSPNMEIFLLGRMVQGLGGGLLAGLGFAVIRTVLPARLWTRAAGLVSAMWGVGSLVGPALGGLFAQFGLWRGAFGLLLLITLVLAFLSRRALPHHPESQAAPSPVPVLALILLTLAAAAFSVTSVLPRGVWTLLGLLLGVLLLLAFVWRERSSSVTVLPKMTYQRGNRLKWVYLALGAFGACAMVEAFVPLFGQELGGLVPLSAGFLGAALSVGWTSSQLLSVSLTSDAGKRRVRLFGPLLLTLGLVGYGALQQAGGGLWLIIGWAAALLLAGVGIGVAFPHFSTAALTSTDDEEEGRKAAAGISTTQLIANAVVSAFAGILVNLGAPSMLDSARYMAFGIAAIAVLSVAAAVISLHRTETKERVGRIG